MSNKHTIVKREIVESIRAVEEANKPVTRKVETTSSFSTGDYSHSVSSHLSADTLKLIAKMKREYFG